MTPERWLLIKSTFQKSLDLPTEQRAAFISTACGGDQELLTEVESLLASHVEAGEFLEAPAEMGDAFPAESPAPGDKLGVYQIVQRLGEGGMSVVYQAARDDEQFRQLVAVKVLKRGMDTDFLVRRFRTERQILAAFDHPNIARIFDGGSTPDGRPYFVMEFVAGKTIDAYCDERKLSVRARLELFLKVCSAVEYAHQNLVVHRDIKPSNILVTEEGEPKLLDFGIAKLLEDDREITVSYLRLMTPEYASPEQIDGQRVNTRSDVYSLGVVLFELLTGQKPYRLKGRSLQEARDAVLTAPPKPSTVAGRSEEQLAELRGTRRERLQRLLEDDLDNIVGMAMRKEPSERYASVGQFAADIRRHFTGEPILARKDSLRYRAAKFLQRHRVVAAATAGVILALTLGIVLALYSARVAQQQRAQAERRFNQVRDLASSMLYEVHDAIAPLPGSTSARELIVRRAQEYLDNLSSEGGISLERERAEAYLRIGDVLGNPDLPNLGDVKGALASYQRALALNQTLADGNRGDIKNQAALAMAHERVCMIQNRMGDFQGALASCGAAVKLREQIMAAHPNNMQARGDVGYSYERLGDPYFSLGDWERAGTYRAKALATFEELARTDPKSDVWPYQVAYAHHWLAAVEEQSKRFPSARMHAEKAVEGFQAHAAAHRGDPAAQLQPTFALQRLGSILMAANDLRGALTAFEQSLPIREEQLALDPKDARARLNLARSYNSVGYTLILLGEPAKALKHFKLEEQLARELVEKDADPVEHQNSLATAHEDLGLVWKYYAEHEKDPKVQRENWARARPYFAQALEIAETLRARGAMQASYNMFHQRLKDEVAACDRALSSKFSASR